MINYLLQSVLTDEKARSGAGISLAATKSADNYLPWSDVA